MTHLRVSPTPGADAPPSDRVTLSIRNPWTGAVVGEVPCATRSEVVAAIDAATAAAPAAAALPSHARAALLGRIADGVERDREALVELLVAESGKPRRIAASEVDRTVFVFRQASEEATRIGGEVLPMDLAPHGEGRLALTRRFPMAPIAAITPFNFPLLLAAHKLAPAIACGATVVLKPPPQDPLSTLKLAEILAEAGVPDGMVAVVPCTTEDAAPLLDDPRIRMISFTGSAQVGWMIRSRARHARVALELGGNAAVIIGPDADLEHAVARCVQGGYAYAGQSCISTQRILVHASLHDAFVEQFTAGVAALRCGVPADPATDVGPLIDEASAVRAIGRIEEAVAAGARVATGGRREGAMVLPTVLLDTTSAMRVNCEEVFAPVTTVRAFGTLEEALGIVNDSAFGLQMGLFTNDLRWVMTAFERADVGAVVVNDVAGFRVDHLPYGGVKQSGLGREGVRSAIEGMTELRMLMLG